MSYCCVPDPILMFAVLRLHKPHIQRFLSFGFKARNWQGRCLVTSRCHLLQMETSLSRLTLGRESKSHVGEHAEP